MTDESWTQLVLNRAKQTGDFAGIAHSLEERIEIAQIRLVETKRMQELNFTMGTKIDPTVGASDRISMGEVRLVREAFAKTPDTDEVAAAFGIDPDLVMDAVNGRVWPYAGGPLRPPTLSGLNPITSAHTANQKRFVKAAIALAQRELETDKFEVFCNNNGMEVKDAKEFIQDLEKRNVRLNYQRYRGVLIRHSEGEDVERCLVSYKRKGRKPKPTA